MGVRIDKSRNDSPSGKVNKLRVTGCHGPHLSVRSHCHDAVARDRDRSRPWLLGVDGDDVSVVEDEVRMLHPDRGKQTELRGELPAC